MRHDAARVAPGGMCLRFGRCWYCVCCVLFCSGLCRSCCARSVLCVCCVRLLFVRWFGVCRGVVRVCVLLRAAIVCRVRCCGVCVCVFVWYDVFCVVLLRVVCVRCLLCCVGVLSCGTFVLC